MSKFCISILAMNNLPLTKRCIESVLKNSGAGEFASVLQPAPPRNVELILTDNGSTDGTDSYFHELFTKHYGITKVGKEKNEGFIAPNRHAFNLAVNTEADYFVMLNNDTTVPPGWLDALEAPFKLFSDAALSGPEGGGCHILPNFHGTQGVFEYLEGSCLCCKISAIKPLGLFPPQLSGAYGEDSCLSLRVREAGYTIHRVKLPIAHVRGATSSQVPQARAWQEANHTWLRKRFAHYLRVRYMEFPILIRRADAWGDVLLVTPIIRALRKHRPLSPLYVETNCADVFRDNPHIVKAGRNLPIPKDAQIIDLNMAYEGMKEIHIVDAYAKKTLDVLGGDFEVADKSLDFYCHLTDSPTMGYAPGAKVVAIHAGPVSWRSKEWGAEKFNVVTKQLLTDGWTVILVGSTKAAPIACTTDLRGVTTVHQLAALLGSCNLFIGLDSFPLHLAQAMGTPAIGLFGVTSSKFILTSDVAIGIDSPAPSAGLRHRTLNSKMVDDSGAAMNAITTADVLATVGLTQLA